MKIFEKSRFQSNISKISILVKILEKIPILVKILEKLWFPSNFFKISISVKIAQKGSILVKIVEKSRFGQIFYFILILVKFFDLLKTFENSRLWLNSLKIQILVKIGEILRKSRFC